MPGINIRENGPSKIQTYKDIDHAQTTSNDKTNNKKLLITHENFRIK